MEKRSKEPATSRLHSVQAPSLRLVTQEPVFTTAAQRLAYEELKGIADILSGHFDAWAGTDHRCAPIMELIAATLAVNVLRRTMIGTADDARKASAMLRSLMANPRYSENFRGLRPFTGAARERYLRSHGVEVTPEESYTIIDRRLERFKKLVSEMGS